ncbi:MAG: hypothetical protein MK186_02900 [Henriciella sp.]|nr:hypothetical protein [Henriciella sp.]
MFSTIIKSGAAIKAAAETSSVNALSLGGKDFLSARAVEVTGSPVLPLEVVIVMIGGLLVSGFALLLRETRIERRKFKS